MPPICFPLKWYMMIIFTVFLFGQISGHRILKNLRSVMCSETNKEEQIKMFNSKGKHAKQHCHRVQCESPLGGGEGLKYKYGSPWRTIQAGD